MNSEDVTIRIKYGGYLSSLRATFLLVFYLPMVLRTLWRHINMRYYQIHKLADAEPHYWRDLWVLVLTFLFVTFLLVIVAPVLGILGFLDASIVKS